mmetsp:Transcript_9764/g.16993  ORF Transcript_9764/g.16993 Transcript_9764/m.16993 type:complete len:422 (-) Transcript_9764:548-1813(-)
MYPKEKLHPCDGAADLLLQGAGGNLAEEVGRNGDRHVGAVVVLQAESLREQLVASWVTHCRSISGGLDPLDEERPLVEEAVGVAPVVAVAGGLEVERHLANSALRQDARSLVRNDIIAEVGCVLVRVDKGVDEANWAFIADDDRPGNLFALAVDVASEDALDHHLDEAVVRVDRVVQGKELGRLGDATDEILHGNAAITDLSLERDAALALEDLMFREDLAVSSPDDLAALSRSGLERRRVEARSLVSQGGANGLDASVLSLERVVQQGNRRSLGGSTNIVLYVGGDLECSHVRGHSEVSTVALVERAEARNRSGRVWLVLLELVAARALDVVRNLAIGTRAARENANPLVWDGVVTEVGHVLIAAQNGVVERLNALVGDDNGPGDPLLLVVDVTAKDALHDLLDEVIVGVRLLILRQERL